MGRQCGTSIRKSWVFRRSVWLCLVTEVSTSALERSSHCAPSATIKCGARSAISESSSSTASTIRKRSSAATSVMPEAARRASCCGPSNWTALPSTGGTRLVQALRTAAAPQTVARSCAEPASLPPRRQLTAASRADLAMPASSARTAPHHAREGADAVAAQMLTAPLLATAWPTLDRFEGPGYQRILVPVFSTELDPGQAGERRPYTVANLYAAPRPVPVRLGSKVPLQLTSGPWERCLPVHRKLGARRVAGWSYQGRQRTCPCSTGQKSSRRCSSLSSLGSPSESNEPIWASLRFPDPTPDQRGRDRRGRPHEGGTAQGAPDVGLPAAADACYFGHRIEEASGALRGGPVLEVVAVDHARR